MTRVLLITLLVSLGLHLLVLRPGSGARPAIVSGEGTIVLEPVVVAPSASTRPRMASELSATEEGEGETAPAPPSATTASQGPRVLSPGEVAALGNPPPVYPEIALRNGWEGESLLNLQADANARVIYAELARTSGYDVLNRAALEGVRTWRLPAPNERFVLPVVFRLD